MKRILKNWNLFELVWLGVFSAVAIVLTVLWKDNLFGFTVFITGILCVVFAAKGNIFTYECVLLGKRAAGKVLKRIDRKSVV